MELALGAGCHGGDGDDVDLYGDDEGQSLVVEMELLVDRAYA